jgi:hypothetical protein
MPAEPAKSVSIWLHDDVPTEISGVIENFHDAYEPAGYCVVHVPDHVMKSEAYQLALSLPFHGPLGKELKNTDPRLNWLPMFDDYLFGTNDCFFQEHPLGDGYLVIFCCI